MPWVIAMLTESNNRALQVVPVRDREGTPIGLRCFRRCGLRWKMNLLLLLLLPVLLELISLVFFLPSA